MEIDHIGIVVKNLEEGITFWEEILGYKQYTDIVTNTRQKVKVVFLTKQASDTIKLIEPLNDESPILLFAKRGGGLHHLCFKCNNLDETISELNAKGIRTITQPEPGEAFNNHRIAFLHSSQNIYFELIDTSEKAAIK